MLKLSRLTLRNLLPRWEVEGTFFEFNVLWKVFLSIRITFHSASMRGFPVKSFKTDEILLRFTQKRRDSPIFSCIMTTAFTATRL